MEMKIPRKYQHEYIVCLPESLEIQVMKEVKKVIAELLLNKEEKEGKRYKTHRNEKKCML